VYHAGGAKHFSELLPTSCHVLTLPLRHPRQHHPHQHINQDRDDGQDDHPKIAGSDVVSVHHAHRCKLSAIPGSVDNTGSAIRSYALDRPEKVLDQRTGLGDTDTVRESVLRESFEIVYST